MKGGWVEDYMIWYSMVRVHRKWSQWAGKPPDVVFQDGGNGHLPYMEWGLWGKTPSYVFRGQDTYKMKGVGWKNIGYSKVRVLRKWRHWAEKFDFVFQGRAMGILPTWNEGKRMEHPLRYSHTKCRGLGGELYDMVFQGNYAYISRLVFSHAIYASLTIRFPTSSFSVTIFLQFSSRSQSILWEATKWIFDWIS